MSDSLPYPTAAMKRFREGDYDLQSDTGRQQRIGDTLAITQYHRDVEDDREMEAEERALLITEDWLRTFCRVDGNEFHIEFAILSLRADGSCDCYVSHQASSSYKCPKVHLGNKWHTRGDVMDLLDGMKISTVKEPA